MNKENFQNSETIVNLCRAFVMESEYSSRTKFMSEKAKEEKYYYLKDLLNKEHERQGAQAKVFYDAIEQNMNDLGIEVECEDAYSFRKATLEENFKYSAQEAEICRDEVYPHYIEVAKQEGFKEIAEKFEHMLQIKDCLYMMMDEIYTKLNNKSLYKRKEETKWKCDNCGHEHSSKEAWTNCPFCGYEQGYVVIELKDSK